jgi:hypothetical protein
LTNDFVSLFIKKILGNGFVIPKEYDEIRVIRFKPLTKKSVDSDYKIKLKLWTCISRFFKFLF